MVSLAGFQTLSGWAQASAFFALTAPDLRFLRSYHDWMRGLKRAAKVAASMKAHAKYLLPS